MTQELITMAQKDLSKDAIILNLSPNGSRKR